MSPQQVLERLGRVAVGFHLVDDRVLIGEADAVHEHGVLLRLALGGGPGGDGPEVVVVDGSDRTTAHLVEQDPRADHAHEYEALDGFDVGAGSYLLHRDGDA